MRIILLVIALLNFSYYFSNHFGTVFAQELEEPRPLEGMTISPALIERDISPGEVLTLSFEINNNDPEALDAYLSTVDFTGDPQEGGSPRFYQDSLPTAFSSWIKLSVEKVLLTSGGRKEVTFTITVPEDAEPGGHYGAIVVSRENPGQEEGLVVGATAQIGTLLLTKVAGEAIEKGQSISFTTNRGWYEQSPVVFEIRFENTGNVHTKPTGVIEIFNTVGVKEKVLQINPGFGSVLPKSIRLFEVEWDVGRWLNIIPRMGKYRAEGLLSYGLPSTTEKLGTVTFWLIPYRFLAKVAGVVFVSLLIIWLFLRLYARTVISRRLRERRIG